MGGTREEWSSGSISVMYATRGMNKKNDAEECQKAISLVFGPLDEVHSICSRANGLAMPVHHQRVIAFTTQHALPLAIAALLCCFKSLQKVALSWQSAAEATRATVNGPAFTTLQSVISPFPLEFGILSIFDNVNVMPRKRT